MPGLGLRSLIRCRPCAAIYRCSAAHRWMLDDRRASMPLMNGRPARHRQAVVPSFSKELREGLSELGHIDRAKLRSGAPIGGRTPQPLAGTRSRALSGSRSTSRGPVHALRLAEARHARNPNRHRVGRSARDGPVDSLSRPGANITGLSQMGADSANVWSCPVTCCPPHGGWHVIAAARSIRRRAPALRRSVRRAGPCPRTKVESAIRHC